MNYRGLLYKILFCYSIVITVYFFKITDNSNSKHEFMSVKDCISNIVPSTNLSNIFLSYCKTSLNGC